MHRTNHTPYGDLNGHAVGIILKELVRRALYAIQEERRNFEVTQKVGYDGNSSDLFTSADTRAQEIYLKSITECFPNFGVLAEEGNLSKSPAPGCPYTITVDPLDGTKAFVRGQSHGTGTMIALLENGVVISAWIGDINTEEIYGFRPDSDKVHRMTEFHHSVRLEPQPQALHDQYAILRDPLNHYSNSSRRLVEGHFKSHIIEGGSIGVWFARLWKGEVGGLFLLPSHETPWDSAPVIGISKKLGFIFLRRNGRSWVTFEPNIPLECPVRRDHEMIVVHKDNLGEIL